MRNFALIVAAAGAIGLAVPTSANAGFFTGLQTPAVESNTIDARCYHRRHWSGWRCYGRHGRWRSRRAW